MDKAGDKQAQFVLIQDEYLPPHLTVLSDGKRLVIGNAKPHEVFVIKNDISVKWQPSEVDLAKPISVMPGNYAGLEALPLSKAPKAYGNIEL